MNLIVHIGTPKTGTTTIQEMLFENREALRSNGFHFLQCAGKKNNRALPAYCVDNGRDDDFFRDRGGVNPDEKARFRDELRSDFYKEIASLGEGVHTVILSSEQFSSRLKSDVEVRRFYDLISPHFSNSRILCYLREQCDMAASLYSTAMRSGVTWDFKEHLQRCRLDNSRYNYYEMLNRWAAVFGAGNIKVRVFDKNAFVGGDLIYDFLSCISPNLNDVINRNISYQNSSINVFGQRLLLIVNRVFKSAVGGRMKNKKVLRRSIMKGIESRFPGKGFTSSKSDYQRIYDSFYESNRMLNKKYFGKHCALFDFSPPSQ